MTESKDTEGGTRRPGGIVLPPQVEEVFREFRTCEFSTLTRDGAPVAWP